MPDTHKLDFEDWLSRWDMSATPNFNDKLRECEFYCELLSKEVDRDKFRWLFSGFLNAAYSFFESSAFAAHFRFTDSDGKPYGDYDGLSILTRHVSVTQRENNPSYVKTTALTPLTKQLYEIRKKCTHHFSLSIMITGQSLPEDFHLGDIKGEGVPVMPFCRDVLRLIREVYGAIND